MDFLFLACVDLNQDYSGIARKVCSEYRAINRQFDGCLVGYAGKGVKIVNGDEEKFITGKKHRRLLLIDEALRLAQDDVKYVYIRRMPCNPFIISMLSKLKKQGVKKIIWEIPTYPYDYEHANTRNFYGWLTKKADQIFRIFLKNYVDRIVTFSNYEEIFGIQTINTGNGLDVASVKPRNVYTEKDASELNLIAVAVLDDWHGYDRLIQGIYEYYNNGGLRPIVFHLVGDGNCLQQYKELAKKLHIQEHIIFYGFKNKDEIDEIYDKCNIAVDSLGWHRSQVKMGTSLKSREYLAKGLPIVASTPMDIFPDGWEYAYYAPVNESPINMEEVFSFYDNVKGTGEIELAKKIRQVAFEKCDMSVMMQPIIDFMGCETTET